MSPFMGFTLIWFDEQNHVFTDDTTAQKGKIILINKTGYSNRQLIDPERKFLNNF